MTGTKTGTERTTAPAAEVHPEKEVKLQKPPLYYESQDLRDLAALITRDIFTANPNVSWGSISGLEGAKRVIKEAIVFPLKFPSLFCGLLRPWKGILLYGVLYYADIGNVTQFTHSLLGLEKQCSRRQSRPNAIPLSLIFRPRV